MEKWFRIEKVETPSINLMNRSVVLKEVQLRLLIAEQALNQGKMTEYQNELQSVMQKLDEMPDATSQQLKKNVLLKWRIYLSCLFLNYLHLV